jgi:DNA repair protein RecO
MAYAIYITDALVCGTFNRNTADCSYLLFTREAGMLYADARSVREEKSRQRYALQDFSLVRVSLVKGKQTWRIGSIEAVDNYYRRADSKQARGGVVSVFRLLRRFVKGEEASAELFDFVLAGLKVLKTENSNQFVAEVVQLRIMAHLGYVDSKQIPEVIRRVNPEELIRLDTKEVSLVVDKLYAQAVESSHL